MNARHTKGEAPKMKPLRDFVQNVCKLAVITCGNQIE